MALGRTDNGAHHVSLVLSTYKPPLAHKKIDRKAVALAESVCVFL